MNTEQRPRTILLVEDNPDDVELTRVELSRCGLAGQLVVAGDGAEALDYLLAPGASARSTAIVLLDLKMPKVDGIEVLRRIREEPALRRLPVVVLTSSKFDEELVESYDLAANGYLRKPIESQPFLDTVRRLGLDGLALDEPPYPRNK